MNDLVKARISYLVRQQFILIGSFGDTLAKDAKNDARHQQLDQIARELDELAVWADC